MTWLATGRPLLGDVVDRVTGIREDEHQRPTALAAPGDLADQVLRRPFPVGLGSELLGRASGTQE